MTEPVERTGVVDIAPVCFRLVDFREAKRGTVIALVDYERCESESASLAAKYKELLQLDYVTGVDFTVDKKSGRVTFTLTLKPSDLNVCSYDYMPDGRRETLLNDLNPTYRRLFGASADVVRDDRRRLVATIITLTNVYGEPVAQKEYEDALLDRLPGVNRVMFDSGTVKFVVDGDPSLEDDGIITGVVQRIADALKGDYSSGEPVPVRDSDPTARLVAAFDYRS